MEWHCQRTHHAGGRATNRKCSDHNHKTHRHWCQTHSRIFIYFPICFQAFPCPYYYLPLPRHCVNNIGYSTGTLKRDLPMETGEDRNPKKEVSRGFTLCMVIILKMLVNGQRSTLHLPTKPRATQQFHSDSPRKMNPSEFRTSTLCPWY